MLAEWAKEVITSVLDKTARPREAISGLMLSFGRQPAFPPGVLRDVQCDLDGALNRLLQPVEAHLNEISQQALLDFGPGRGTAAESQSAPQRKRRIRSKYLRAIREALFGLDIDAPAQTVADWIAEELGAAEFEQIVKKYGKRADLGALYRDNPQFRAQFDRDVTKVRSLLD